MSYLSFDNWWWPYVFILLCGALPTEIWRWAGIFLSKGLGEGSDLLIFVRSIANALIAGLIIKLILFPTGVLEAIPLSLRIGAMAAGFIVVQFSQKNILFAILAAEIVLLGGAWILGVF